MCKVHSYHSPTDLQVGFEVTEVEVLESQDTLLLCVNVTQPDNAPIDVTFELEIHSQLETAGKEIYSVCSCHIGCVMLHIVIIVQMPQTSQCLIIHSDSLGRTFVGSA